METSRINTEFLKEIEKYACNLIQKESSENLMYHTIEHTKDVVKSAQLIGKKENLEEDNMNILLASAWFHDIGYTKIYYGHEKESAEIAKRFLQRNNIDKKTIDIIYATIMATMFPYQPKTKLEEILCDADMAHLAKENYFEYAENLRKEWANSGIKKLKKLEFEMESVQIFKKHTYFTKYAQDEFTQAKKRNLDLLEESISKRQQKNAAPKTDSLKYSRGVDSMFKLTARNQINLSSIADNKSNILISLNGIIISLGIASLVSKFKEEPAIIIPTVIFILFSLITIILSILSTRPNISKGRFSREDVKQNKINLLFFGSFYNMQLDEYEWAVKEMINDDSNLYSTMTKDQYFLGKVLAKKYKLLRWAYNVFMVGIVISVIAFLLVFLRI